MSNWVVFAIIAYLFNATNAVVDKFMLNKTVKHPVVYAFYTGVLSFALVVLVPFVSFPGPMGTVVALLAGAAFSAALYFLYTAIQTTSISRVLPIEGGFIPVFTLLLAYLILGERLSGYQYLAFVFLVVGAVVISIRKETEEAGLDAKALAPAVLAAACFAVSFVLMKYTYNQTNFLSGLVWTRMGLGLASLAMLIPKSNRQHIFQTGEKVSSGSKWMFYSSKLAGALGGLMENYAISLGSVTLVKALQGTQYLFLLILTSFLTIYFPKILKERITVGILIQKLFAIGIITIGLILLTQ